MSPPELPSRPGGPEGAVRRLSLELLQFRLFGGDPPRLGRFEVQRKVGEGAMGAVFEAVDPVLRRRVALKLIRREPGRAPPPDPEHEARMLARLSHPHVVAVFELGEDQGERYVCMAFVDGPDLATWLGRHPEAGWRQRLGLLRGAAAGLAAAHAAGLVHRDCKLENILVGSDGLARVTDFGLAREGPAVEAAAPGGLGPGSSMAGTPAYMAPEVLRGGRATEQSDQYSFFVAVRRAMAGCTEPAPAALHELVARGTAEEPALRCADMAEALRCIDALLEQSPLPDQRARDVLLARLDQLWVQPLRSRALSWGPELEVEAEPVAGMGAAIPPMELGSAGAEELAEALWRTRAGVVLLGAPGGGKSLRLAGVAQALLRRAREGERGALPVLLHLTGLASQGGEMAEWVVRELVGKYALPRDQASAWLEGGELVLLLDGLDEVRPEARGGVVEALEGLRASRPTPFLVACREENYRALPRWLRCDALVRLRPLRPYVVEQRLARLPPQARDPIAGDPALASALSSPLLLALFSERALEIAQEPGAPGALSAERLQEALYARALAHALDAPPPLEGGERAGAEAGLRWLASALERAGRTELWLEEMQVSWLEGRGARALALGCSLALIYGFSVAVNLGAARLAGQPWYSGIFFGLLAVTAALFIQGGLRITPMERMRWSWARVRRWIPRNLALGLITGGLHGVFFDLWADLMLGVATGLLGLSVIGLEPAGRERRVNPGDGLWESLRNSLLLGPLTGLVIGVPVGYLVLPLARPLADPASMYHTHPNPELAWALSMGTSAMVTSLFITGALAPVQHLCLRLALALSSPLPLRLRPWLDGMVERGLLHRVGGGWAFRHATFRRWLAGLPGGTAAGQVEGPARVQGSPAGPAIGA